MGDVAHPSKVEISPAAVDGSHGPCRTFPDDAGAPGCARPSYLTLAIGEGCNGDAAGLASVLGDRYEVLFELYDDSEGYGHHFADAIFRIADGRIVHAECGGCSCEGNGSWSICASLDEALQRVPEWRRPVLA